MNKITLSPETKEGKIVKFSKIGVKSRNFLHVGIIKLILPNAKIIDSVRFPEDTCLSLFRLSFSGTHNDVYNLTEFG